MNTENRKPAETPDDDIPFEPFADEAKPAPAPAPSLRAAAMAAATAPMPPEAAPYLDKLNAAQREAVEALSFDLDVLVEFEEEED